MFDRLEALEEEFETVEARLSDPDIFADQEAYVALTRRHKELEAVVAASREHRQARNDLATARDMLADLAGDDREMVRAEINDAEATMARLEEQLKVLLLPKDPNDGKNVIVEIRGAEGGEEANLFAKDLFEMYQAFAGRQGWKLEVMEASESSMGGFDGITFTLRGASAWTNMKHEGGTHRVQRVPVTESQGRVHTSSATVTVLPEAEEVELHIDPNDLQVDVYRSSGPGGQSVNTTDSAVRLTHKPTGLVVAMQDEKSQIQNRAKALVVLRSRLLKAEQDRQRDELSEQRRGQVGGGGRAEKVRTYNFKENRLTDHRVGYTAYNLDKVLDGELEGVVDALLQDERASQLSGE
ncbi:MAG TPA: peptide chain release factor 1 [Acidimicrobiales bacterium]|nr:peptide chain release factor 1 [Acidimicrobiales bacterium]